MMQLGTLSVKACEGAPASSASPAAGPAPVRVMRPGHPLHGLDLLVWRHLRLRGTAMLEVVLPDGSKKRIPASWAGAGDGTGPQPPAGQAVSSTTRIVAKLDGTCALYRKISHDHG
jgi:hypothetical protein